MPTAYTVIPAFPLFSQLSWIVDREMSTQSREFPGGLVVRALGIHPASRATQPKQTNKQTKPIYTAGLKWAQLCLYWSFPSHKIYFLSGMD